MFFHRRLRITVVLEFGHALKPNPAFDTITVLISWAHNNYSHYIYYNISMNYKNDDDIVVSTARKKQFLITSCPRCNKIMSKMHFKIVS